MVLPPKTAFMPMQEFFFKQACVPSPMHSAVGLIFQGGKGETNTCVFPTLMLLESSWIHSLYFKVCLHGQSQTCSIGNCSYPQALLLLPPSEDSTAQYLWLTHGTCSSPQNFLPYSNIRTGKCAGRSLHSVDSSRSTSMYRQTLPALLSHWRAETGNSQSL